MHNIIPESPQEPKHYTKDHLHHPHVNMLKNMFDFLKAQQYRYPELAKLDMDILCVPVSTVASESTFSCGGRILNEYRNSLRP